MRIIAGPCQHETLEQSITIAEHCKAVCEKYNIDYYFKASYDKANRTNISGKRGVGLVPTMHDFKQIKQSVGVKIVTDVHESKQVEILEYFGCVDVYQIPAFLCRQTDLIRSAVETGKTVNIKKGQFLAPWDVAGILSKTQGAKETWITERGTSFGYNTLVVDFTGLAYMRDTYNCPIFLDATHAVQRPGGNGTSSGGNRAYVPDLCYAAAAMGVDNFFLEVHPDPDNAPSDGPNMLRIEDFETIVRNIHAHRNINTRKI